MPGRRSFPIGLPGPGRGGAQSAAVAGSGQAVRRCPGPQQRRSLPPSPSIQFPGRKGAVQCGNATYTPHDAGRCANDRVSISSLGVNYSVANYYTFFLVPRSS